MTTLITRDLAGLDYLAAVTDLLLRLRGEDPLAGLHEAGDLQWWWKDEELVATTRHTFWYAGDRSIAAFIVFEEAPDADGAVVIEAELISLPSAGDLVRAEVLPVALGRMIALTARPGAHLVHTVDERDLAWRQMLEQAGFRPEPAREFVQLLQRPAALPPSLPLPAGLRFADERARPPDRPHHLAKRNGAQVADRLRECSLYRPDLDLSIVTDDGEVVSYTVCWLDEINRVGLFEPVRTEDAWQRRGLGRALMVEGIRRLLAGGADLLKVTTLRSNEAACRLYQGVGFAPLFAKLCYVRDGGAPAA